ncbi:hypothetical protein OG379_40915 (plasmid) [Streptomyces sp. NBC_01166]|nr:hypothetical protein OG379_40915 [Streptomyces sp. NBC_01166]
MAGTLTNVPNRIPHVMRTGADDELVAAAVCLRQAVAPGEVVVVSRDIGVRTRARPWGLSARALPDTYLIEGGELRRQALARRLGEVGDQVGDGGGHVVVLGKGPAVRRAVRHR